MCVKLCGTKNCSWVFFLREFFYSPRMHGRPQELGNHVMEGKGPVMEFSKDESWEQR